MESTKKITTLFMIVTVITMAVLAFSVNRNNRESEPQELKQYIVPGLAENMRSLERLTGFPAAHIHAVDIFRTNGRNLELVRENPAADDFEIVTVETRNLSAFSAILYTNATFLDEQLSADSFVITGYSAEQPIARLVYRSFDGVVIVQAVIASENEVWSQLSATVDLQMADKFSAASSEYGLYPAIRITDIANRLNGRVYKRK